MRKFYKSFMLFFWYCAFIWKESSPRKLYNVPAAFFVSQCLSRQQPLHVEPLASASPVQLTAKRALKPSAQQSVLKY